MGGAEDDEPKLQAAATLSFECATLLLLLLQQAWLT